jgi:hypothetical protein
MDHSLAELLSEIPDNIFFDSKGDPKFNTIFVEVARIVYKKSGGDFSIPVRDLLTDKLPNLSTFQHVVTKERKKRAS